MENTTKLTTADPSFDDIRPCNDSEVQSELSKIISDENQEKLKTILDKFTIIDCAEGFEDVFENIKTKYANHIPEFNQEQYLNGLLGFVINPKIVKDALKISRILIIFAVTVGGAYFGFLGMFLGVPIIAVIKTILNDFIENKNKVKKIEK